jgi:hypothetical protein
VSLDDLPADIRARYADYVRRQAAGETDDLRELTNGWRAALLERATAEHSRGVPLDALSRKYGVTIREIHDPPQAPPAAEKRVTPDDIAAHRQLLEDIRLTRDQLARLRPPEPSQPSEPTRHDLIETALATRQQRREQRERERLIRQGRKLGFVK